MILRDAGQAAASGGGERRALVAWSGFYWAERLDRAALLASVLGRAPG